jgi:heparan-alpha-glucosaminide N-acetyltransferase
VPDTFYLYFFNLYTTNFTSLMNNYDRVSSIDIMRGLTLVLMLFVNDLYMQGVPGWLGHMAADFDGMGLADWVFPGFLFMVGMAIPYSIGKRISDGQTMYSISRHIVIRTVSLISIGVLMLNSGRVNPEFTGIGKNLWAILMYTGVFLIWNDYRDNDKNFFTIAGLRLAGIALLVFLVFKFRSGEFENNGSLITSWWGILGLIGWGYLVAAFIYLAGRNSIIITSIALLFFLGMNILTKLDYLYYLNPVKPVFGVIIEGNVPMIVISGMLTTLILKKYRESDYVKTISTIAIIGILSIATGFILRRWFIISKIQATPSWGMICNGISMIIFAFLYWIIDIKKYNRWAFFLKPAGENSLTTYLAPDIVYYLIWSTGLHILVYKQSGEPLIVIAGSIAWALLMVGLTKILLRFKIKLKL